MTKLMFKAQVQEQEGEWNPEDSGLKPADTAEYVAGKILEAIESEEAEIYVHDWMNRE